MTRVDEMLMILANCPRGDRPQIDDAIVERLFELRGKPSRHQAFGIKSILDDCVFGSLASDFAVSVMNAVWEMAKEDAAKEENGQESTS